MSPLCSIVPLQRCDWQPVWSPKRRKGPPASQELPNHASIPCPTSEHVSSHASWTLRSILPFLPEVAAMPFLSHLDCFPDARLRRVRQAPHGSTGDFQTRRANQRKWVWGQERNPGAAKEMCSGAPFPSLLRAHELTRGGGRQRDGKQRWHTVDCGPASINKTLGEVFQKEMVLLGWLFSAKGQLQGTA